MSFSNLKYKIKVEAYSEDLKAGDLVYVEEYWEGTNTFSVRKAKADEEYPKNIATLVMIEDVNDGRVGYATREPFVLKGQDTDGRGSGVLIYLSKDEAGAWTEVPPIDDGEITQAVGAIKKSHPTQGEVIFGLGLFQPVKNVVVEPSEP